MLNWKFLFCLLLIVRRTAAATATTTTAATKATATAATTTATWLLAEDKGKNKEEEELQLRSKNIQVVILFDRLEDGAERDDKVYRQLRAQGGARKVSPSFSYYIGRRLII